MLKKVTITVLALLLIAIGIALWTMHRSRPVEPEHQGKKLTAWLKQYQKQFAYSGLYPEHPDTPSPSQEAIRHIGTNAIPFLLTMAETHDSMKVVFLAWLSERLHPTIVIRGDNPDRAVYTQKQAAIGFEALAAAAKPAVPALIRMLGNGNHDVRFSAAVSLSMIGPPAREAVPTLLSHVNDRYLDVQTHSIIALGEIHADASKVVPVLTNKLVNDSRFTGLHIIQALGKYGAEAKAAAPFITPNLTGQNSYVMESATNALKQIDPETAAKAGIK